jgi:hypothetical protein
METHEVDDDFHFEEGETTRKVTDIHLDGLNGTVSAVSTGTFTERIMKIFENIQLLPSSPLHFPVLPELDKQRILFALEMLFEVLMVLIAILAVAL